MRILYLTHRLPYAPNRGDRIRAHHMLRHLASRHEVDLVSFVHDDEEESHRDDLAGIADSVTTVRIPATQKFIGALSAFAERRTLTHALLDAVGFRGQLAEVVSRRRPDVVLAYCSGMARFALQPPLEGIPLVLDMVDVDSGKWAALATRGRGPRRWLYAREAELLRDFERQATKAARVTLVVNEREQMSLRAISGSARIDVAQNGIDVDTWRAPSPPSDEPRVVFCGVMNYEPNETGALWLLRDVWPRVRGARPDATLTLAGAHPTRRLRRAAEADASVEVTGSVPDVRPFLWKSALSVAPLFVARGLQNKVLEATAAGLPSVVSKAVAEGLPSNILGACAESDTAESFAAEILRLLSLRPEERRAVAERANLAPLSWKNRLAHLDKILSDSVS